VELLTIGGVGRIGGFAFYPSVINTDFRSDLYLTSEANMSMSGFTVQHVVSHELNHTIGLLDIKSTALFGSSVDSHQFSIMSYENHAGTNLQATELQLYDIAALQSLYGRTTFNNGDTDYSDFADGSGPRMFSIWDSGGTDTIDATGQAAAALLT
jgi:serralysin